MKRYVLTTTALVLLAAGADAVCSPVQAQDSGPYVSGAPLMRPGSVLSGTSWNVATTDAGTVLDFEDLAAPGSDFTNVVSYSKDGFTLFNPSYSGSDAFGAPESDNRWNYQGSTSLLNRHIDNVTMLKRDDGGTFAVGSIDLTNFYATDATPCQVTFTGTRSDGTTVRVTFKTDGVSGFETFTFAGFTDLVSLSWMQAYPYHQFDNIVLDPSDPTPQNKGDCMDGGWQRFGFANQGLCVRLVETGKDSR